MNNPADNSRTRKQVETESIIGRIATRLDALEGKLRPHWREKLCTMNLPELQQADEELQRALSLKDANSAVVSAIAKSSRARQAADKKMCDDRGGPADVSI